MLTLTIDVDWAADAVLADTLQLLTDYDVNATIFATHKTHLLEGLPKKIEVAIHPNFNDLLLGKGGNFQKEIDELMTQFPSAKGVRSHSLVQSSHILNYFVRVGLAYDSNLFLPYQNSPPFHHFNGFVRIPYNWEDDYHYSIGRSFDAVGLNLEDHQRWNILNFHPIHLFLNTENQDRYNLSKPFHQDVNKLGEYCNRTNVPGTRDCLKMFLEYLKENHLETHNLEEIAADFRNNYEGVVPGKKGLL